MDDRTIKKVLVATDFSDGSDEALERAIEIAKPSRAAVELLHVLELVVEFPFGTTYGDEYGALYASVDRELGRRADRVRSEGLSCETKIVEGSAAAEIAQRGREMAADLIVVGTHGRTGLAHVMMGSVAEHVVRRSVSPVLTVPFSKKAAA